MAREASPDVLNGWCLDLIQHAQQKQEEAGRCHSKEMRQQLLNQARKFEVAASMLHGDRMSKEDGGQKVIAKAIAFLALYDPNNPEAVDRAVEKANEVVDKLSDEGQVEVSPKVLNG